ncbi:MAG: hypothetical protein MUF45_03565 [Spirosomaceae bacterium]|jgi:hypothetical protein|nr:hypothetical protein [Spirosomataceae bacterium]
MQSEDELRKKLSGLFDDYEAEAQDESWEAIRSSVSERQLFSDYFSNYEAEPQTETWDAIRNGVEDEKLKEILGNLFANFEAEPHDNSWDNINANVEDSALKGILAETFSDFEAQPDENSWDFIQAKLDKDTPLKTELSSIFADFEAQPTAESWITIKANIQKEDNDRGIIIPLFYRVGIAASIALLLGFFLWNFNKTSNNQTVISQSNKIIKESNSKPNIDSKISNSNKNSSITKNTFQNRQSEFASNRTKTKQNIQINPINKIPIDNSNNIVSNNPKSYDPTDLNSYGAVQKISSSLPTISGIKSKEFKGDIFHKEPLIIAQNNDEEEIYPETESERRSRNPLILTGNLMPIQTYQVFTILPQSSTTYIQQVGQLSTLDNQRLGVQARLGIMKNLTRKSSVGVSLAYTGMQQWANYSVSNGIYDVTVGSNDEVTVSPVTESIAQESFLHALGLKFEHSYMVTKRRSKVYLIGGGEAVRKLNKNQFGYFLNASIGVSYPIAKNNSLWIEPTIRYGLTSTFDNNNYLKIRPYNIGLNFRVNIGK